MIFKREQTEVIDIDDAASSFDVYEAQRLLNRLKYIAVVVTALVIIIVFGAWANHQATLVNRKTGIVNGQKMCEIIRGEHLPDTQHLCR